MFRLVPALCLLASVAAFAQDAPPVNADAILRDIENLEQQQKRGAESHLQQLLARLQKGLNGGTAASGLYEDAVRETEFRGKKDHVSEFEAWRKKNSELLRSREMQQAVQLHLKYLTLSLLRKSSDKPEDFVKPSFDYLGELVAFLNQPNQDRLTGEVTGILSRSLTESPFTKWLELTSLLPDSKNWELSPGNGEGILEKNIRPVLREAKSPQLIETWDLQIKNESDRVRLARLDLQTERFETLHLPRLQFARAEDLIVLGQTNRGVSEMVALIKRYPQHPDFAKWVERVRLLLKPDTSP